MAGRKVALNIGGGGNNSGEHQKQSGRRVARFVLLSGVLLLCAAPVLADRKTWEYDNGHWSEVKSPTTAPVSDPTLDQAALLLTRGMHKEALKILLDWEKVHKKSPVRDRALFLISDCFYQYGNRIKSFYYLDEILDEYPDTKLFYPTLEKQYQIADAFLDGYKLRLLYMPVMSAEEQGVEMMYRIQQRAPGSSLAERALLRTADYYFSNSDFDLAFDAYAAYARAYPHSSRIARVRLRQAFSSLAQFRGLKFDATDIIDARAQLVDIEKNYPELAAEENVPVVIDQIDSAFAAKILETGEFYERVHQPRGAVYHYRYLVETYPNSPEAGVARKRLVAMPVDDLSDAPPPPGEGYAPATQPSASADGR